jgi:hypothetical protein
MNNKVIGRDAMFAGERLQCHARDNYGGRRGLRAAEVSMNQLLTYNSIWARRGRAVVMSNDAKGMLRQDCTHSGQLGAAAIGSTKTCTTVDA